MVLTIAFVGPVISTFFDQWIRNMVDDWMSEPDLFESISIRPDEYAQLPPYWRQALAEIALRPKEEVVDVQNVIEGLRAKDCAVERRVFLVGANPTQQLSFRLVAAGAVRGGNDMD